LGFFDIGTNRARRSEILLAQDPSSAIPFSLKILVKADTTESVMK
jgi:hypothetical protein